MILRNRSTVRSVVWLALACAGLAFSPARAQIFGGDDEARQAIIQLRQELRDTNDINQRARLQLADQVEQLQKQVELLRGQLESVTKQVSDTQQSQRDLYRDLDERQRRLDPQEEGKLDAAQILAGGTPEQASYDAAINLFRNGDFQNAVTALTAFLKQYPESGYAPTASFYIGSASYALKDYRNTITQLQAMVKNWPTNARAPDALLVIASSQIELGNRNGARATLQRIVKEYASSPAASTAKERLPLLQ